MGLAGDGVGDGKDDSGDLSDRREEGGGRRMSEAVGKPEGEVQRRRYLVDENI